MISYKIEDTLAILSENPNSAKMLTLTSWNDRPCKLDLRLWRKEEGEIKPGKGVTLTDAEAADLYIALAEYFRPSETNEN